MSSMQPFYNTVVSDPVKASETFAFQSELVDLLLRYQPYLQATGGANMQQLKQLRGGTVTVAQSSGTLTLTVGPNPVTPNPNPSAT